MTSLFAAVALMTLLPATAPPPSPATPASMSPQSPGRLLLDGTLPQPPRDQSPEPDGMRRACTCKCGSVYREVDSKKQDCKDLTGEECVTKAGTLALFEDCALRFIGNSGSSELEPEIVNPGGPM